MQSGMIKKVAVTPTNALSALPLSNGLISRGQGILHKPSSRTTATQKGIHLAAVRKNNKRGKNVELDRYYTHLASTPGTGFLPE